MKTVFYIRNILSLDSSGFYNSTDRGFGGINLATQYSEYDEAMKRIEKLPSGFYQIDKVFVVE